MSRSQRDVQRVKAQGQGKGAILVAPPGNYFTKLIRSAATKRRQDWQTKQLQDEMLFALPKGTSGSLAIRHSDRQAVLGPVRVLPNAPLLQKKQCSA